MTVLEIVAKEIELHKSKILFKSYLEEQGWNIVFNPNDAQKPKALRDFAIDAIAFGRDLNRVILFRTKETLSSKGTLDLRGIVRACNDIDSLLPWEVDLIEVGHRKNHSGISLEEIMVA